MSLSADIPRDGRVTEEHDERVTIDIIIRCHSYLFWILAVASLPSMPVFAFDQCLSKSVVRRTTLHHAEVSDVSGSYIVSTIPYCEGISRLNKTIPNR